MKLAYEQIKEITQGAEDIKSTFDGIQFFRFTEKELQQRKESGSFERSYSTAGVRLEFETDSRELYIKFAVKATMQRTYMAVDVLVNGQRIGSVRNSPEDELLGTFFAINPYEWKDKVFEGKFDLGEGTKKVSVYLPWNYVMYLQELSLDDTSFVKPYKRSKKMLVLGDSITHGFDAVCPSRSYASIMTAALDAEEYNKAIGGDKFTPAIADALEEREYDYVSIAYGTNDWCCCPVNIFIRHTKMFYEKLTEAYPDTRIFAITPIWRKNWEEDARLGKFFDVEKNIKELTKDYENVTVIEGFDLIPHEDKYFSDAEVLHPNDEGFKLYGENLALKIKEKLI